MGDSFRRVPELGDLWNQGSPALEDAEGCDRCELASEHLGRDRGGLQQLHCRKGSVILHCCILHHLWPLTCESLQSL